MNDATLLLWAILDKPEDDTLRLAYADCLDEQGDAERAAFIRVQIEMAQCEKELADRFNDETDWSQCTGVSAGWCPVCGDCTCRNREESMSDDDCPLHAQTSNHCCLDMIPMRCQQLREREEELLARWVNSISPSRVS